MINEYEDFFVSKFIVKDRQNRLLYELSGKKRQNGIEHFCHSTDKLIRTDRIIASDNKLHKKEIIAVTEKFDFSDRWYIMSSDRHTDKKICSLDEALDLVLGNRMAAIILSDRIAIIETEQCFGTPKRYILFC